MRCTGPEESAELTLEGRRLLVGALERVAQVLVRVQRAIEDERAEAVGEQRGVRRAEERPVRVAEVGQLLVADRLAQHVHVARRLGRGDVRQDVRAVEDQAAVQVTLVLGEQGREVQIERGRERLGGRALRLLVDLAVDRARALAGPARVEAHDVVLLVEGIEKKGAPAELQEVDLRTARSAEVEDQRADLVRLVLGRNTRHGDVEGLAVRPVVVERDGLRGALDDDVRDQRAVLPLQAIGALGRCGRRPGDDGEQRAYGGREPA